MEVKSFLIVGTLFSFVISGCAATKLSKDQIIEFPSLVQTLKESILVAEECAAAAKMDPLFQLGEVVVEFETVATRGGNIGISHETPILGVVPVDLSAKLDTSQTQKVKITLIPSLILTPGELVITVTEGQKQPPINASFAQLTAVSGGEYLVYVDESGKEHWNRVKDVLEIVATPHRKGSGLPPEEVKRRCGITDQQKKGK